MIRLAEQHKLKMAQETGEHQQDLSLLGNLLKYLEKWLIMVIDLMAGLKIQHAQELLFLPQLNLNTIGVREIQ